jgi:hypothetical protein
MSRSPTLEAVNVSSEKMENPQNSLNDDFPTIQTLFATSHARSTDWLHRELIREITRKVLPEWFFAHEANRRDQLDCLRELLPIFTWSDFQTAPFDLSFYVLCKSRPNAFRFFFEMVSRWLIPGRRMNVLLASGFDFSLPDLGADVYTVMEVMLRLDTAADVALVRRNLPALETEIRLGVQSAYHASRILEIKGLSSDEKTAMIQENIADLVRRRPRDFDDDIFAEMQHFMVMCGNEFKSLREFHHMSRIICVLYLFRRTLRGAIQRVPEKRHVFVKLMRARLRCSTEAKTVLGLYIGLNFLRSNELLEQRHVLRAVQNHVPGVSVVEGSYLAQRSRGDSIQTIYIEVEKEGGAAFTMEEVNRLKRGLHNDLNGAIEHQMHPVFMPRNEEEIMRSILTLAHQLRYVRDLPQVMVSFDEQTDTQLVFTVILLRVLRPFDPSIEELFAVSRSGLVYQHDSTKSVGLLRKKYPKEATVFRLLISKDRFLRSNHSIDLRRARQTVVSTLMEVVGEVRDFNGGMISKQDELLDLLMQSLGPIGKHEELLLESFFHALTPVVVRSVLQPGLLKRFFVMFLQALAVHRVDEGYYDTLFEETREYIAVMITADDFDYRDTLCRRIDRLSIPNLHLVTVEVEVQETCCMGLLFRSDDSQRRRRFRDEVQTALNGWKRFREPAVV